MKKLTRKKNESSLKVISIKIILVVLGYLAGATLYNLIKGILNFDIYGVLNLGLDLIVIAIAVFIGWWLWDYNGIFSKNKL